VAATVTIMDTAREERVLDHGIVVTLNLLYDKKTPNQWLKQKVISTEVFTRFQEFN
jgi:hypothetical protein